MEKEEEVKVVVMLYGGLDTSSLFFCVSNIFFFFRFWLPALYFDLRFYYTRVPFFLYPTPRFIYLALDTYRVGLIHRRVRRGKDGSKEWVA